MASRTKQTKARRKRKATKLGQGRKKNLRNKGSTPKFSIHPPVNMGNTEPLV